MRLCYDNTILIKSHKIWGEDCLVLIPVKVRQEIATEVLRLRLFWEGTVAEL